MLVPTATLSAGSSAGMATGGFAVEAALNSNSDPSNLTYCGLKLVLTKGSTLHHHTAGYPTFEENMTPKLTTLFVSYVLSLPKILPTSLLNALRLNGLAPYPNCSRRGEYKSGKVALQRRYLRIVGALTFCLLIGALPGQTTYPPESGFNGLSPAPVLAINDPLGDVVGLAADSAGNYYIGDATKAEILKVNRSGYLTTYLATYDLVDPAILAYPSGDLLFFSNNQIMKLSTSGVITLTVGTGALGYGGDGGPATEALIYYPQGLALDSVGNLYIADTENCVIREVTANDGVIHTIAGQAGVCGYSGDGGPALSATLNFPLSVAAGSTGTLYISDTHNYRVRAITSVGIINTIAGNGIYGSNGNGGAATNASLNPGQLLTDKSGNVLVIDSRGDQVRKVNSRGVITAFAGDGIEGFSGDGGPATKAEIFNPSSLALSSSGSILIDDTNNHRVRTVLPNGTIQTIAGDGQ